MNDREFMQMMALLVPLGAFILVVVVGVLYAGGIILVGDVCPCLP